MCWRFLQPFIVLHGHISNVKSRSLSSSVLKRGSVVILTLPSLGGGRGGGAGTHPLIENFGYKACVASLVRTAFGALAGVFLFFFLLVVGTGVGRTQKSLTLVQDKPESRVHLQEGGTRAMFGHALL